MRARGGTNRLTAAFWLATLALLLLALIPGGLMPAKGWHGSGPLLMSCPDAAPTIAGPEHEPAPASEEKAPRAADTVTCAFAGLIIPHLPHGLASALEPPAAIRLTDAGLVMSEAAAAARMSSPPPPSQAPPSNTI